MKMKRWLSRGLVIAMIVALMIPVPVAAKGSKAGGKLVKNVTTYEYTAAGRWQAERKVSFTYDKKYNPSEIEEIEYNSHFLGAPVGGVKTIETAKYKYKGKTPKSMKFKDGAGKVTETRKYKKGRVVSIVSSRQTSEEVTDWVEQPDGSEERVYKGDDVDSRNSNTTVAYDKKGLATAYAYSYSSSEQKASGAASSYARNENEAYVVTQKKGIPSYILTSESYGYTDTDAEGTYSYQKNADGTWTRIENGTTETGKNDFIENGYTKFNSKGLTIESGTIRTETATGAQKVFPEYKIEYTGKKGKIKQAVVSSLKTDENGNVTKTTPVKMYKFKYAKTKISAVRYLSMMNSLVGYHNAFFAWY